jgi:hypothetical protein
MEKKCEVNIFDYFFILLNQKPMRSQNTCV